MSIFIIAEAGVNHNGNLELAKKLIDVASDAGCDAVKFQTFKSENLVTKTAKKAEYQVNNMGSNESQYEMLKKLELDYQAHLNLYNYCKNKNIMFLSTPFDEESADLLERIGIDIFKIPSGEITNKPFLEYIARKQKPMILSTGMSTLGEVEEAIDWIIKAGNSDLTLLHCTSNYPTRVEDVNLNAMLTLKNAFKIRTGYSDHTLGNDIPIAAAALGAEIIEKHFTLDKNMSGPDHKASLDPDELMLMVKSIRNVEVALGSGIKKPTESEMSTRELARKSIVTSQKVYKGDIIRQNMLRLKRPGIGLSSKNINLLIGKKALKDLPEDHIICLDDFIC